MYACEADSRAPLACDDDFISENEIMACLRAPLERIADPTPRTTLDGTGVCLRTLPHCADKGRPPEVAQNYFIDCTWATN